MYQKFNNHEVLNSLVLKYHPLIDSLPNRTDNLTPITKDGHVIVLRDFTIPVKVSSWFNTVGLNPEFIQIFCSQPFNVGFIHKDGLDRHSSFNLPFFNSSEGFHEYFDESLTEKKIINDRTMIRITEEEANSYPNRHLAEPIEKIVLDYPTLFNVNRWHRVNNNTRFYRAIVSIRFDGNPSFETTSSKLERLLNV